MYVKRQDIKNTRIAGCFFITVKKTTAKNAVVRKGSRKKYFHPNIETPNIISFDAIDGFTRQSRFYNSALIS